MNEDQARTRLGNGPNNLAVLRHMAINVMQKNGNKDALRGKFQKAAWDNAYLSHLLCGTILKCDCPVNWHIFVFLSFTARPGYQGGQRKQPYDSGLIARRRL